jgi:hypothetical protein
MLRADPDWAWTLLERLALRVRHLVGRLDRNTAQSVPARLASFLLIVAIGLSDVVSLGRPMEVAGSRHGS